MRKVSILVIILVLINSCKKAEDDELSIFERYCNEERILGRYGLTGETKSYFPYENSRELIFRDSSNRRISFLISNEYENEFQETQFNIGPGNTNPDSTRYCYEREFQAITYHNEDLNLNLSLTSTVENVPKELIFYDAVRVIVYETPPGNVIDQLIQLNIVSDFRGNSFQLSNLIGNYEFETLPTFQGVIRVFEDVFLKMEDNGPLKGLYFTKQEGVIGFLDLTGKLWLLDEIK